MLRPNDPELVGYELTPALAELEIGESQQFGITAHYDDESTETPPDVKWEIQGDEDVAEVDEDGLVTALSEGTVELHVLGEVAEITVTE